MDKSSKNVREYSFHILSEVLLNEKLLNKEIERTFNSYVIKDEDKSFIKKECTGVIENLDNINSIINLYSKLKTNKLKKDILIVFRLATYELLYMDKVPVYATINESVNILKHTKYKNLTGYVNATLKNIANNEKNHKNEDTYLKYKVKHCYFKTLDGSDDKVTKELKDKKIGFYKYDGNLNFKYSNIYYVDKYKTILETNSFKEGHIIIQDASSAYLVDRLYGYIRDIFKNLDYEIKILDTCSAPGGKIVSLYDLVKNEYKKYKFEARDISSDKINKIKENLIRLRIDDIVLKIKDASVYDEKDFESFDIVLCDVPCSGLGVVNKKPDILIKTSDGKIKSLNAIQKCILETSKKYVKKGGILSYSTCTTTKEENEDLIAGFLNDNDDFEKIYEKQIKINDDSIADGFYMCFMRKV